MFRRSSNWCYIFVAIFVVTQSITDSWAAQPRPGGGDAATAQQGPPAAADGSPAPAASRTVGACRSPPPGDAAVSSLQSLSEVEKSSRLIQAAKDGAVGDLQALLAAGADAAQRDPDLNYTALHWAAFWGHVQVARCLLEAGAPVDARNNYWATPLHFAAGSGHTAVVRLLLEHSADPNAGDDERQTPLHWAAEAGHRGAAEVLLAAGADRAARDSHGNSPADLASQNGHQLAAS